MVLAGLCASGAEFLGKLSSGGPHDGSNLKNNATSAVTRAMRTFRRDPIVQRYGAVAAGHLSTVVEPEVAKDCRVLCKHALHMFAEVRDPEARSDLETVAQSVGLTDHIREGKCTVQ